MSLAIEAGGTRWLNFNGANNDDFIFEMDMFIPDMAEGNQFTIMTMKNEFELTPASFSLDLQTATNVDISCTIKNDNNEPGSDREWSIPYSYFENTFFHVKVIRSGNAWSVEITLQNGNIYNLSIALSGIFSFDKAYIGVYFIPGNIPQAFVPKHTQYMNVTGDKWIFGQAYDTYGDESVCGGSVKRITNDGTAGGEFFCSASLPPQYKKLNYDLINYDINLEVKFCGYRSLHCLAPENSEFVFEFNIYLPQESSGIIFSLSNSIVDRYDFLNLSVNKISDTEARIKMKLCDSLQNDDAEVYEDVPLSYIEEKTTFIRVFRTSDRFSCHFEFENGYKNFLFYEGTGTYEFNIGSVGSNVLSQYIGSVDTMYLADGTIIGYFVGDIFIFGYPKDNAGEVIMAGGNIYEIDNLGSVGGNFLIHTSYTAPFLIVNSVNFPVEEIVFDSLICANIYDESKICIELEGKSQMDNEIVSNSIISKELVKISHLE